MTDEDPAMVTRNGGSILISVISNKSHRRIFICLSVISLLFYMLTASLLGSNTFGSYNRGEVDAEKNKVALIRAYLQKLNTAVNTHSQMPSISEHSLTENETEFYGKLALRYFFAPKMSLDERRQLLEALRVCLKVVENVKLPYFLYGGTLIGYHRHNASIIPWDDDADVALLTRSEIEVRAYISKLYEEIKRFPGYTLTYVHHHRRFKCFGTWPNNSQVIEPWRQWRWPFVDLQFMREIRNGSNANANKIIQDYSSPAFLYPVDVIYPLRRVNFSEIAIPAFIPHNTAAAITKNYRISECKSASGYDHRREKPTGIVISVECSSLKDFISFTNLIV